jgi:UDP-4-amino-4,6-dideoxy-N-acetyl-beta-L-altrosamine transaminase
MQTSRPFLNYGRQDIDEADIRAVVDTLRGDYLTQGPAVAAFEKAICQYTGASYAVAVANGTGALHIACLALGLGAGDAVIVPAITFAATSNSVLYAGATPFFADIDPETNCISVTSAEAAIQLAVAKGLEVKAIFPVHFAGLPCQLKPIMQLAEKHGLAVVEDACHAIGARYRTDESQEWSHVGTFPNHIGIFSFHPVKHITTGEGGCLVTDNPNIARKLMMLRTHGITKDSGDFINQDLALDRTRTDGDQLNPWYHEMQMLGFNYRMCDMQAALGVSQMRRIDQFIERRRQIADVYRKSLSDLDHVTLPAADTETERHSYHLFHIKVDFPMTGGSRRELMLALREKGVGTQVHYLPVPMHPYYAENPQLWLATPIPHAMDYYQKTLSIPMFQSMTDDDARYCAGVLRSLLEKEYPNTRREERFLDAEYT